MMDYPDWGFCGHRRENMPSHRVDDDLDLVDHSLDDEAERQRLTAIFRRDREIADAEAARDSIRRPLQYDGETFFYVTNAPLVRSPKLDNIMAVLNELAKRGKGLMRELGADQTFSEEPEVAFYRHEDVDEDEVMELVHTITEPLSVTSAHDSPCITPSSEEISFMVTDTIANGHYPTLEV